MIINTLEKHRQIKGSTQADVADYLSISTRQYQRLEAGTSDGSIKLWVKLANYFNTTIDALLEQGADDSNLSN